jgi:hypothetical protein
MAARSQNGIFQNAAQWCRTICAEILNGQPESTLIGRFVSDCKIKCGLDAGKSLIPAKSNG